MSHDDATMKTGTATARQIFPSQWNAEGFKKAVKLVDAIDLDVELGAEIHLMGQRLTTGAPVHLGAYRSSAEGLRVLRAETSTALREMMGIIGVDFAQIAEDLGISITSARKIAEPRVNGHTFALLMNVLTHYGCEAVLSYKVVGENLPALAGSRSGTDEPGDGADLDSITGTRPGI